jgi:hypothetical protein
MPACDQCGKDNPAGTAFCGYCATPLTPSNDPGSSKPGGRQIVTPQIRGGSAPPPKPSKPEIRTPTFNTATSSGAAGKGKGKGGFELLPWSELSSSQRAGRVAAIAVVLFLILFFLRTILRSLGGRGTIEPAPSAQGSGAPITEGDRKDGIESLCKVFQIYGLPKSDHDAADAAHNASELFKLAGNQSPERSSYILNTIVADFRSGKLGQSDCAEAGAPVPTNPTDTPDSSSTDAQPGNNQ